MFPTFATYSMIPLACEYPSFAIDYDICNIFPIVGNVIHSPHNLRLMCDTSANLQHMWEVGISYICNHICNLPHIISSISGDCYVWEFAPDVWNVGNVGNPALRDGTISFPTFATIPFNCRIVPICYIICNKVFPSFATSFTFGADAFGGGVCDLSTWCRHRPRHSKPESIHALRTCVRNTHAHHTIWGWVRGVSVWAPGSARGRLGRSVLCPFFRHTPEKVPKSIQILEMPLYPTPGIHHALAIKDGGWIKGGTPSSQCPSLLSVFHPSVLCMYFICQSFCKSFTGPYSACPVPFVCIFVCSGCHNGICPLRPEPEPILPALHL